MSVPAPHFLLYAEAARAQSGAAPEAGAWRFVLRLPGGETSLEAADEEPEATPQRLELLAVVRGLEALSQPSRVTLLTGSRYLRRGLDFGISQWRENDWQWERYGRMAQVKNSDLWQRLDWLLNIHELECKPTRLEKADDLALPRRDVELPAQKRGGRVVRVDVAHTAAKAESRKRKARTNLRFKGRKTAKSFGFGLWMRALDVFFQLAVFVRRAWSQLVIRTIQTVSAHRLQTRSEES
jgi:ribonuclease HI